MRAQLEAVLRKVPGTRSVYAERELGGFFIDFTPDRQAIARLGCQVSMFQDAADPPLSGAPVVGCDVREDYGQIRANALRPGGSAHVAVRDGKKRRPPRTDRRASSCRDFVKRGAPCQRA